MATPVGCRNWATEVGLLAMAPGRTPAEEENVHNLGWTPRADSCLLGGITPGKTQKSSHGCVGVKAPGISSCLSHEANTKLDC